VLDVNPASDADCWIAYSLIEAGRLWHRPIYLREGKNLLFLIEKNETRFLPGYGWALLPGPYGFVLSDGTARQNPSYLPMELLARFGSRSPRGPWPYIVAAFLAHLPAIAPHGFAPDWFAVKRGGRIEADPVKGSAGSYDAIRVYLWAGLLPVEAPLRSSLLEHLGGMKTALARGPNPPLSVDSRSGRGTGTAPPGFSSALLPYLKARINRPLLQTELMRLEGFRKNGLYGSPPAYYDQILALFGQGSLDRHFSFGRDGCLILGKET